MTKKYNSKYINEIKYESIKNGILLVGLSLIVKAINESVSFIAIILGLLLFVILYRTLMIYVEASNFIENKYLDFFKVKEPIWLMISFPIFLMGLILLGLIIYFIIKYTLYTL